MSISKSSCVVFTFETVPLSYCAGKNFFQLSSVGLESLRRHLSKKRFLGCAQAANTGKQSYF
jgi:hypothetical protein